MFKKILSIAVIICFLLTALGPLPQARADSISGLPLPGTMINLSPAYQPVMIKGLTVHKDNPFLFDFIVDVGQDRMSGEPLKTEGEKLIKYFLASLAIPDKDVWVNLSPYEKNRIIPEALGQTDMGRDLLEQDYILKQITASLIYPEKQLGQTFWNKVYAEAQQKYGTTQIPVNTFNKVWIMADRAEVFEHNQTAFVVDSHLKVMLEEDYLALQKHNVETPFMASHRDAINRVSTTSNISSSILRSIILPELEKEVNTGKNFANLRQIFNSVILSSWYKNNLKQALLNQVYANKAQVKGINLNDPSIKEQIYEQYLKAYKKGVFNYIKEEINAANGKTIPRQYFSGGILDLQINPTKTANPAELDHAMQAITQLVNFNTGFEPQRSDAAMTAIDLPTGKLFVDPETGEVLNSMGRPFAEFMDRIKDHQRQVIIELKALELSGRPVHWDNVWKGFKEEDPYGWGDYTPGEGKIDYRTMSLPELDQAFNEFNAGNLQYNQDISKAFQLVSSKGFSNMQGFIDALTLGKWSSNINPLESMIFLAVQARDDLESNKTSNKLKVEDVAHLNSIILEYENLKHFINRIITLKAKDLDSRNWTRHTSAMEESSELIEGEVSIGRQMLVDMLKDKLLVAPFNGGLDIISKENHLFLQYSRPYDGKIDCELFMEGVGQVFLARLDSKWFAERQYVEGDAGIHRVKEILEKILEKADWSDRAMISRKTVIESMINSLQPENQQLVLEGQMPDGISLGKVSREAQVRQLQEAVTLEIQQRNTRALILEGSSDWVLYPTVLAASKGASLKAIAANVLRWLRRSDVAMTAEWIQLREYNSHELDPRLKKTDVYDPYGMTMIDGKQQRILTSTGELLDYNKIQSPALDILLLGQYSQDKLIKELIKEMKWDALNVWVNGFLKHNLDQDLKHKLYEKIMQAKKENYSALQAIVDLMATDNDFKLIAFDETMKSAPEWRAVMREILRRAGITAANVPLLNHDTILGTLRLFDQQVIVIQKDTMLEVERAIQLDHYVRNGHFYTMGWPQSPQTEKGEIKFWYGAPYSKSVMEGRPYIPNGPKVTTSKKFIITIGNLATLIIDLQPKNRELALKFYQDILNARKHKDRAMTVSKFTLKDLEAGINAMLNWYPYNNKAFISVYLKVATQDDKNQSEWNDNKGYMIYSTSKETGLDIRVDPSKVRVSLMMDAIARSGVLRSWIGDLDKITSSPEWEQLKGMTVEDAAMITTIRTNPDFLAYGTKLKIAGVDGDLLEKYTDLNLMVQVLTANGEKRLFNLLLSLAENKDTDESVPLERIVKLDKIINEHGLQNYISPSSYMRFYHDRPSGPKEVFEELSAADQVNGKNILLMAKENVLNIKDLESVFPADLNDLMEWVRGLNVIIKNKNRKLLGKALNIDVLMENFYSWDSFIESYLNLRGAAKRSGLEKLITDQEIHRIAMGESEHQDPATVYKVFDELTALIEREEIKSKDDYERIIKTLKIERSDAAMKANIPKVVKQVEGGVDLNTSNGMQWKISKDGRGVDMNIDSAMIARLKQDGIESLSPVIFKITPIASIWTLVGIQAPVKTMRLASV